MASARRLRTIGRQNSKNSEGGRERDEDGGEKSKQKKRKLSEMLGPPWNEGDLEAFYQAYRKFGKNWKKVSVMLHERTVEMVEALYGMNKAYLSLPEGVASVAGLKAMMTDHYNILEENRSDGDESSENIHNSGDSRQNELHSQGFLEKGASSGMVDVNNVSSAYNGPSPAKRRRTVRSRMALKVPQIPCEEQTQKKVKTIMSGKQEHHQQYNESNGGLNFNKAAKAVVLTLAKASKSIASPQVSHTSPQMATYLSDKKDAAHRNDSGGSDSRTLESTVSGHKPDLSKTHKKVENGLPIKSKSTAITNLTGAVKKMSSYKHGIRSKSSNTSSNKLNEDLDRFKEECKSTDDEVFMNGTETDDENAGRIILKPALLLTDKLSPERIKKRSRQLFCGDESSGLDTLATLAEFSLNGLLPSPKVEPAKLFEEEGSKLQATQSDVQKTCINDTQPLLVRRSFGQLAGHGQACTAGPHPPMDLRLEGMPSVKQRNKSKHPANTRSIPIHSLKNMDEENTANAENKESVVGGRLEDQEEVIDDNSFPIRCGCNKRNSSEKNAVDYNIGSDPSTTSGAEHIDNRPFLNNVPHCPHSNPEAGPFHAKARLIHCLDFKVRKWCTYEWFYSAIDLPWFSQNEFVEYLNHAGLGKIPKLTRIEWGVIRSSLGKPRRFSSKFLQEEREKLETFREEARKCYYDLRTGMRSFLPADLAYPLTVGQRVIARHQRTRQLHDGNILTVDLNRCRVQFDRTDLGVEFIPDIGVMPVNPLENMSEVMRKQHIIPEMPDRFIVDANGIMSRPVFSAGGAARAALNESLERPGATPSIASPSYSFFNALSFRAQADTVDSVAIAKAAANEAALAVQQAACSQTNTCAQVQVREADIRALAELSRTLDKKEALLVELRNMNDEVDPSIKGMEAFEGSTIFQRQYAMVVLQLKEVNKQVSAALLQLRNRNRYQENPMPPRQLTVDTQILVSTAADPEVVLPVRFESGVSADETIASAKKQARVMVFTALKAMASLKEGEDALLKLGGALSSLSKESLFTGEPKQHYKSVGEIDQNFDCGMATHQKPGALNMHDLNYIHDAPFDSFDHKSCFTGKESTFLSELMAACVATLLLIQTCTEACVPPSRVAVLLTSALENLRPQSSENQYIYNEIEQCLDTIQSQIVAQIPIESNMSSLSFSYARQ